MTSFEQLSKVAQRADKMLLALTKQIQEQKQEFQADVFYQVYSKSAVAKLPKLTRASVDGAVGEMELRAISLKNAQQNRDKICINHPEHYRYLCTSWHS